jgi:hypothetical protein
LTTAFSGGFIASDQTFMKATSHLLLTCMASLAVGPLAAEPARPHLEGRVASEPGQPLKGASIFIYTAGPKVGVGTL